MLNGLSTLVIEAVRHCAGCPTLSLHASRYHTPALTVIPAGADSTIQPGVTKPTNCNSNDSQQTTVAAIRMVLYQECPSVVERCRVRPIAPSE